MRHDDRRLAGALERLEHVQQERVVAVLGWWPAELEAAVVVLQAVAPGLERERRIHDHEVEGPQLVAARELRAGDGVALRDVGVLVAVQDHVHLGQRPGGVVLLLAVDGEAARRLGRRLEQQRAGAAGRVVDRLVLAGVLVDADDLGQDAGHLGRGVELALALAGLGGEVPHQVLVGVAEQVVALGAGAAEVEVVEDASPAWRAGPASPCPCRASPRR